MFGIRGSQPVRFHDDCERWRERNNLSQSEAALKLQISKRTLQEWEQGRSAPRGFARTAIKKTIRA
jgi:DNA-binding transcriptional regulator YiaG